MPPERKDLLKRSIGIISRNTTRSLKRGATRRQLRRDDVDAHGCRHHRGSGHWRHLLISFLRVLVFSAGMALAISPNLIAIYGLHNDYEMLVRKSHGLLPRRGQPVDVGGASGRGIAHQLAGDTAKRSGGLAMGAAILASLDGLCWCTIDLDFGSTPENHAVRRRGRSARDVPLPAFFILLHFAAGSLGACIWWRMAIAFGAYAISIAYRMSRH